MRIGKIEIYTAWDGYFRLDGGAMFGVVPKPLWSRSDPPDERNRILLSMNPMVIRRDSEIYLVDTGIGDKWDDKSIEIFQLDRSNNLLKSLKELGIDREDVTGVIQTHLHFDHVGGATENYGGKVKPVFTNAAHYIQQGEWDFAESPNERTRASYLAENFQPLREYKKVEFLHGDEHIVPGISVEVTGGHTPDHQVIIIESEGQTVCYLGDLVPTASHLKIPYIMGYDTHPMDTLKTKKQLLDRALRERWLLVFSHSPRIKAGYLEETDSGVKINPVDLNTES